MDTNFLSFVSSLFGEQKPMTREERWAKVRADQAANPYESSTMMGPPRDLMNEDAKLENATPFERMLYEAKQREAQGGGQGGKYPGMDAPQVAFAQFQPTQGMGALAQMASLMGGRNDKQSTRQTPQFAMHPALKSLFGDR